MASSLQRALQSQPSQPTTDAKSAFESTFSAGLDLSELHDGNTAETTAATLCHSAQFLEEKRKEALESLQQEREGDILHNAVQERISEIRQKGQSTVSPSSLLLDVPRKASFSTHGKKNVDAVGSIVGMMHQRDDSKSRISRLARRKLKVSDSSRSKRKLTKQNGAFKKTQKRKF